MMIIQLLQQIGEGGMGVVYMAEQTEPVRRKVALKIIKPGMDSRQVIARFEAERQALALMDHQNIARVLDAGTTAGGRPYFVMELVHGIPITKFCDDRRLTPRQRLELFIPVCQAIQHAHQKGIIHRDVKPSNVLVTMYDDRPVPKVIDFGVAKAVEQRLTDRTLFTHFGALVGTFEYMSPEQAEMNAFGVDTRSDIYSLGVLLYELLTGSTPLQRQRLRQVALDELVRLIKEAETPRPSLRLGSSHDLAKIAAARGTEPAQLAKLVRGEVDWIVMKCLEKDRTRRYETANSLARDIQRYLANEVVEARPASAGYRLRKYVSRHRGPVLAASLVLLALVAGVAGTTWGLIHEGRANAELAAKNRELADEQAKVQARFDLARKAVATLHTGFREDLLLRSDEFKGLRAKLLKEAAGFYGDLEKLLAGQADAPSRRLLADGYFQLAELTAKISSRAEALALHRKALAVRRELAGADAAPEARLDLARSLGAVGDLLSQTGKLEASARAFAEQHDVARALAAEHPTEAAQAVLAQNLKYTGVLLQVSGKAEEARAALAKAVAIQRNLVAANPSATGLRYDLAHYLIYNGSYGWMVGKSAECLALHEDARAILQKLADENPAETRFRYELAWAHHDIASTLSDEGRSAEALAANAKARALVRKLTETHPAVTDFQNLLAVAHDVFGEVLAELERPAEALAAFEKAIAIQEKLDAVNPRNNQVQRFLALSYNGAGDVYRQMGKPAEALQWHAKAREVLAKQIEANRGYPMVFTRTQLAETLDKTGLSLSASGKHGEALAACREALALRQKLSDAQPAFVWLRGRVAGSLTGLGTVQRRAGQAADAVASFRRAADVVEQLPTPTPRHLYDLACCHALLAGVAAEPGSGLPAREGAAAAERAMATLRRAVAEGNSNLAHLRADPYLDDLRSRADFKGLLADLEKRQKARGEKRP
jgi:tetratricopeptide (TPR) repeat protein/tRNA A-37 threonylcarbamoyl transferase component Bud32